MKKKDLNEYAENTKYELANYLEHISCENVTVKVTKIKNEENKGMKALIIRLLENKGYHPNNYIITFNNIEKKNLTPKEVAELIISLKKSGVFVNKNIGFSMEEEPYKPFDMEEEEMIEWTKEINKYNKNLVKQIKKK